MKKLLVLLALVLAGCSSTQVVAEPEETPTVVDLIDWASNVSDTPDKRASADDCWESGVSTRADAYRCITSSGNILDPCFLSYLGVICPFSPFGLKYTFVAVDGLPMEFPEREISGTPYGIELTDGNRCVFITGMTDARGDDRLNYDCDDGSSLWGDPVPGNVWTIKQTQGFDDPFVQVKIKRVVF